MNDRLGFILVKKMSPEKWLLTVFQIRKLIGFFDIYF